MTDINTAQISGVLVETPQLSIGKSGKPWTKVRVLQIRNWGHRQEEMTLEAVAFGPVADRVAGFPAGSRVLLQLEIRAQQRDGRNGGHFTTTDLTVIGAFCGAVEPAAVDGPPEDAAQRDERGSGTLAVDHGDVPF